MGKYEIERTSDGVILIAITSADHTRSGPPYVKQWHYSIMVVAAR